MTTLDKHASDQNWNTVGGRPRLRTDIPHVPIVDIGNVAGPQSQVQAGDATPQAPTAPPRNRDPKDSDDTTSEPDYAPPEEHVSKR